jgi:hypothetical protein
MLHDDAPVADGDRCALRSDDSTVKDTAFFTDRHIAGNDGGWGDIGCWMDVRTLTLIRYEHVRFLLIVE